MMQQQTSEVAWLADAMARNPALAEIASQHSQMIFVAIMAGERDRALQIVSRAFETIDENVAGLDSHVGIVAGERTGAILEKNAGIRTVGQLCKRSFAELLAIRQIDYKTAGRIQERLEKFGFQLKK